MTRGQRNGCVLVDLAEVFVFSTIISGGGALLTADDDDYDDIRRWEK